MSNNRRRERRPRRSDRCGVPAPCPQNLTASPHHIHGTSCQLPHHCEEPSGDVAISCGNVAFCTAVPGDSQKVNCPGGAREATLGCGLRPRNDMVDGSWSNRLQQRPTRGAGNAVPGVPTGAVRKHRARMAYGTAAAQLWNQLPLSLRGAVRRRGNLLRERSSLHCGAGRFPRPSASE